MVPKSTVAMEFDWRYGGGGGGGGTHTYYTCPTIIEIDVFSLDANVLADIPLT